MRFLVTLLLIFASTSYALAQGAFMTGNEILTACRVIATYDPAKDDPQFPDPLHEGYCAGMIDALILTSQLKSSEVKFCSGNASISQAAKVLVKFLDEH